MCYSISTQDNLLGDNTQPPKSPGTTATAKDLFKLLVPLVKSESLDMMEAVVTGLGYINPEAFR